MNKRGSITKERQGRADLLLLEYDPHCLNKLAEIEIFQEYGPAWFRNWRLNSTREHRYLLLLATNDVYRISQLPIRIEETMRAMLFVASQPFQAIDFSLHH